jgi:hypothetical protein
MTILTGSLTSLRLSGSSLVQRKDTGAEVLMDLDFTQLPNQDLTNNAYNSVGGISMQVVTSGNPYFKVVNGEGVSYSNNVTGFGYLNVFYYTTFTGSSVNVADRIRVVAEFSGTRSDAGANSDPNYMTVLFSAGAMQAAMFYRGPWTNQKFNYLSIFTTDSYASNTQINTETGAKTIAAGGVTGSARIELDAVQGNVYTAVDRESSPGGLTSFPNPGDITPQARMRVLSNTSQPQLISNYISPFTGSADSRISIGFDQNQAGEFSGSLQRLTIFRYGAD